jgi:hypothetical protein
VEEIYVIPIQFFLEIYYFPADFPADLDKKICRKHVTCEISCGFGFPAKTIVGNCFLRIFESAGKFPTDF